MEQPKSSNNSVSKPLYFSLSSNFPTSSKTFQTPSPDAPSSAPPLLSDNVKFLFSSDKEQFKLVKQQSLTSRQQLLKKSVSFKKPKMVVPKTNEYGYVNSAYDGYGDDKLLLQSVLENNTEKQEISKQNIQEKENKTTETFPDIPNEFDQLKTSSPSDDDETVDSKWVKISIQWLKMAAYLITFSCVLAFSVLSKSLTLLMTSMVAVNHSVSICNSDKTFIIHEELQHDKIYKVQYGSEHLSRIAWLWSLFFAIIAPYVFAWLRALRIVYFKSAKVCTLTTLVTVFIIESLHCIGLSMLTFLILPYMDAIKGAMMMNSVAVIPSLIRLFLGSSVFERVKGNAKKEKSKKVMGIPTKKLIAGSTLAMQFLSVFLWTFIAYYERHIVERWYLLPVALILISFEWWENYLVPAPVPVPKRRHRYFFYLEAARKDLTEKERSRYFVACFTMPWKILLIFGMMVLSELHVNSHEVTNLMFCNFTDAFHSPTVPVTRVKMDGIILDTEHHLLYVNLALWPLFILVAHISITYLCYAFAKFTCKVCIQEISFAIPVTIAGPCTVSLLWALKNLEIQDKCQLTNSFHPFQYIFWRMGTMNSLGTFQYTTNYEDDGHGWLNLLVSILWFFSLVSQVAATLHIWKETSEPLATTERIFLSPMYNSVLIDQSLAMNRRSVWIPIFNTPLEEVSKNNDFNSTHNYVNVKWEELCKNEGYDVKGIDPKTDKKDDETVRIYACATMWHESRTEMLQMLKAIMRLDKDQGAHKTRKLNGADLSPAYYEIEINVFFDDAFEDNDMNMYVKRFIEVINEAANHVHKANTVMKKPIATATPYGGRLVWSLPEGTRLIAHLKDSLLIRHRKRWSQCMYFYYLLSYRLQARPDLSEERKKIIANNTFVLALDGDINFQPVAVAMVVDLMKRNKRLGAVCGRIHPIGSGPMVWYQRFEYGIGHWLQKSTEHVLGCVLCSPGCFSLFRASAVMDESVMHKYTTKPSEALHYVQYDQGEDRWLCTLLLQSGWRIEFCAASDSYTHAPEGFGEIFIQRRRWAPSTMANILDLLNNYKETVEKNENISFLYILYQAFLMVGTILSPGTIFLMVISAMNSALNLDSHTSFLCNVIAVVAFTFVCLKFENNDIKITFAMLLSLIYSLLMLAVMVGIGIDTYKQGILSPNSLFFSVMMGSFLVAAILHPQEFSCVLSLPLYMLLIPSMYMLLPIYSVTNMHNVNWGTREGKTKKLTAEQKAEIEKEYAEAEEKAIAQKEFRKNEKERAKRMGIKKSFFNKYLETSKFSGSGGRKSNGFCTCNFACCSGDGGGQHSTVDFSNFAEIVANKVVELVKVQIRPQNYMQEIDFQQKTSSENENNLETKKETNSEDDVANAKTTTPMWISNNKEMVNHTDEQLHNREKTFWDFMIKKYLYAIKENREEKERISNELLDLRNKAVFAFAFINIIFILFVFMLQLHKDIFGIDIPVGIAGYNRTYNEEENTWHVETMLSKTRMDPITLCLVIFFGAILIIQIIGMFIHRFGTLAQLLAYTKFDFFQKTNEIEVKKTEWAKQKSNDNTNSEPFYLDKKVENSMTELESDNSKIKSLPQLTRKNTLNAMNARKKRNESSIGSEDIVSINSSAFSFSNFGSNEHQENNGNISYTSNRRQSLSPTENPSIFRVKADINNMTNQDNKEQQKVVINNIIESSYL